MSKFVSALTLALLLMGTVANAEIAIVDNNGTSSGRVNNASSYAVNLPTGVADGDLVVVAIASNTNEAPSAEGYTAEVKQGFNNDADGCFEFYHVWKTGDPTSPIFSRLGLGSDAYATVALSGVATGGFVDTETGTSSEFGTRVNYPAITTHNDNDLDVYAACAEGDAIFSSPTLSSVVVQEDNALSSVAISAYAQPTKGLLDWQALLTDTSLVNGSAVVALIAAPAPAP